MTLIAKPFITINGVDQLCEKIEKYCITSLAMEPVEWKRCGGSEFKQVHVDIDCRRFNSADLLDFGQTILDSPLFHLFIFRENEELYVSKNKELFSIWIGTMRSRRMHNWNVLILPESKTKSKFTLNKFSILAKLKIDFNLAYSEEHFKRVEDAKDEIEQIQYNLRMTVLCHYDMKCTNNEDCIRKIREDIYTQRWDYFEYFLLQEELSDIYECLSLYDEALAQFEEAGYIFTQCIYQYTKKDSQEWLNNFRKSGFTKIDCLNFTNFSDPKKHKEIIGRSICLPDFRAYMLSRQCALLQMLNRFKEIPDRVYLALLEFSNEARMLNIEIDSKLKNCWLYLTGMQALQKFSAIDCEESVAQSYACLLRLSLSSINKLADILGMWSVDGSCDWSVVDELKKQIVVLNTEDFGDTPSSKLNNAFHDLESFRKFHIELYEETITIWKHVGRMRSAAFLGAQLADLHYNSGKYELAEPLYNKAIKLLRNENWAHLAMPLRLKLAVCQKEQFNTNPHKYLKTCVHLAGSTFSIDTFDPDVDLKGHFEHEKYMDELIECINRMYTISGESNLVDKRHKFKLEPLFSINTIRLLQPTSNTGNDSDDGKQKLELELVSHLPRDVDVNLLIHGIQHYQVDMRTSKSGHNSANKALENSSKSEFNNLETSGTSGDSLFYFNPGDSCNNIGGVSLDFSASLESQNLQDHDFHDCNIDSPNPTDNSSQRNGAISDMTSKINMNKTKQVNSAATYQSKPSTLRRLAYKMKKGSGSLRLTNSFDEIKEENIINEREVIVKHQTVCPPNKHQHHYNRHYNNKQLSELSPVHETANKNEENTSGTINSNPSINSNTQSLTNSKCLMTNPNIMVQCLPKYDEGQNARRVSISNIHGNVMQTSASSNSITFPSYMEGEESIMNTKFIVGGRQTHQKIRVTCGVNRIKLISEEYGFFNPTLLEVFLFDNKAVASEYIDSNTKLSTEWTDKTFLDKLLPEFVFNDDSKGSVIDSVTSFIDFDNLIDPKVKIGSLSIPKRPNIFVETSSDYDVVKNRDIPGSCVTYSKSDIITADGIFKANCSYYLKSPLKYRLNTTTNEISLSLANIVTRSICEIPSSITTGPRKLHLSHYLTSTSNAKYLISIELQPSSSSSSSSLSSTPSIEFTLKKPSLKLHHNDDITQVLKLLHNSLSFGKFNDRSKFVLLWTLDMSDVPKLSVPRLVFTLNLDLEMNVTAENQTHSIGESLVLDGSITHQFQLNI